MQQPPHRRVRSFVKRPGRITAAQRHALERLWPRWGVPFAATPLDLDMLFRRRARRVLDIGFGDGEALLTCAAHHPDVDFLGVEVHEPGVGHLLVLLERAGLENVRVVNRDVVDVAAHMLDASSFAVINVFFPDPWPKKRHHKRRLIQPDFAATLARLLVPDGLLHLATDWSDYAQHMSRVLDASAAFAPLEPDRLVGDPLAARPPTRFERRGRELGHEVVDLYYRRRVGG
jgi:tRNA (guanine-N7-)-methyltransferase